MGSQRFCNFLKLATPHCGNDYFIPYFAMFSCLDDHWSDVFHIQFLNMHFRCVKFVIFFLLQLKDVKHGLELPASRTKKSGQERSVADDSFISNHSDANNNSYGNETGNFYSGNDSYDRNYDGYPYEKHVNTYADNHKEYSKEEHSYLPNNTSYYQPHYNATSYSR